MKPKFKDLKAEYPYNPAEGRTERSPCKRDDGSPAFENQCAIRLGIALTKAKVLPARGVSGVAQCWFGHNGEGHTLRVEQLVKWLSKSAGFGAPIKYKGKAPKAGNSALLGITGKQGVVFLKDFWGAGNSGDHIDIWDKTETLSGDNSYFPRAAQVWFWELR